MLTTGVETICGQTIALWVGTRAVEVYNLTTGRSEWIDTNDLAGAMPTLASLLGLD